MGAAVRLRKTRATPNRKYVCRLVMRCDRVVSGFHNRDAPARMVAVGSMPGIDVSHQVRHAMAPHDLRAGLHPDLTTPSLLFGHFAKRKNVRNELPPFLFRQRVLPRRHHR
jgi:hypothetical protein